MACDNCSEELITTSQGPQGEQGVQGEPGTNGTNGVLDWGDFDLSCWIAEGITEADATNDEISQDMIDALCEVYQAVHRTPVAVNDYRTINQDTTTFIDVINNDLYYPDVSVVISVAPSNGTATIESDNKTVKYIPNAGFKGVDDFDYEISDGSNTSSATVSVTVLEVISQQTIEQTVLSQLQILLASDEYWDLNLQVGTKLGISNINLTNFDFTNPFTAGIGTGRYSKWAICNGNNGTEDLTEGTFRGFNHSNADYDESAKSGGSDTVSLTRPNIPAHQHQYFDSFMNAIDGSSAFSSEVDAHAASLGVTQGTIYTSSNAIQEPASGDDRDAVWYDRNTGDGTNNLGNQKEIANGTGTVTAVNIRNAFKTIILIQKIA